MCAYIHSGSRINVLSFVRLLSGAKASAVFVIREEDDPCKPPNDIGIIIEGVEVNELPSAAHGCALLFGLSYALNMSCPGELKHTFDVLQIIFMEKEPKKIITRRVSV